MAGILCRGLPISLKCSVTPPFFHDAALLKLSYIQLFQMFSVLYPEAVQRLLNSENNRNIENS